jgi:hypothetical protein
MATTGEAPEDLNRVYWRTVVEALKLFLKADRLRIGIKQDEKCPRCEHAF